MRDDSTCHETQGYLQELMDGTLAPDREQRLQAHLETCPACAGELALQREMRSRVAAEVPRREVPAELRQRVREILTPQEKRVWGFLPRPVVQWGMAVATLVLIGLVPFTLLHRGREERVPSIVIEAVNDHRSFAMRVNPPALPTADRHQVRELVESKVGFPLDPPVGQRGDLRLVGGDVTYFLERKVACILYGKGPKLVTLLVLQNEGVEVDTLKFRQVKGLRVYTAFHEGTGVAIWKQDNFLYAVVSELPQEELLEVARQMAAI